jgi:hypothetical protein
MIRSCLVSAVYLPVHFASPPRRARGGQHLGVPTCVAQPNDDGAKKQHTRIIKVILRPGDAAVCTGYSPGCYSLSSCEYQVFVSRVFNGSHVTASAWQCLGRVLERGGPRRVNHVCRRVPSDTRCGNRPSSRCARRVQVGRLPPQAHQRGHLRRDHLRGTSPARISAPAMPWCVPFRWSVQ